MTTFFEITFPVGSGYEVADRHEIEDTLNQALQEADLGEVTGGGTGMGKANIDVEVTDPLRGLSLMRKILQDFSIPSATVIRQAGTPSINHSVYEPHA
jgi:hypothetical protein